MQDHGTFLLTSAHRAILAANGVLVDDFPPWNGSWPELMPGGAGVLCTIIADSSVNGGGPLLLADLPGFPGEREAIVSSTRNMELILGYDHPALVESRRATRGQINAQRANGRAIAQMDRDARRLGVR